MVVGRVGFVARPEVEDLAAPAGVAAAATEQLATAKPADEDQRLGGGHVKQFAVHLLRPDLDRLAQPGSDRMPRSYDPDPLVIVANAPLQIATCAHQAFEDLREVARVEHHKAHSIQYTCGHALNDRIAHLTMGQVSPPDQHVGGIQ